MGRGAIRQRAAFDRAEAEAGVLAHAEFVGVAEPPPLARPIAFDGAIANDAVEVDGAVLAARLAADAPCGEVRVGGCEGEAAEVGIGWRRLLERGA